MCQICESSKQLMMAREKLKRKGSIPHSDLLPIWREIQAMKIPPSCSEIYELLGERLLRAQENILASHALETGLKRYSGPDLEMVRLKQLKALALARSGATSQAHSILQGLYNSGHKDGETLGILARTYKDYWEQSSETKYLRLAHEKYLEGYKVAVKNGVFDDVVYTGINAASTAVLLGENDIARSIAEHVSKHCEKRPEAERDDWTEATLGGAALILRDFNKAKEHYCRAGELARGEYGSLATSRHQARLLLEHLGLDRDCLDQCFGIPKVIVFAGHMIDQPGRLEPRFPQEMVETVRQDVGNALGYNEKIGFSGAACGADILFIEQMLEQNGQVKIVLPFAEDGFRRSSVDIVPGTDWGSRFEKLLKSTEVIVACPKQHFGSPVAYKYSNLLLDGLARLTAHSLETEVVPMVVWNGLPGDGLGGTADLVKHWKDRHSQEPIQVSKALLEALSQSGRSRSARDSTSAHNKYIEHHPPAEFHQEIVAVLFADVEGFSRLTEEQIPTFVSNFVRSIGKLVGRTPPTDLRVVNTWGDGFYFVFSQVQKAGLFALDLCQLVSMRDWGSVGLPHGTNIRIALHAGPAYAYMDPVTRHFNYASSHVTTAARIESITPPGQVYASQAFAALAASEGVEGFTCSFVGVIPLAKSFGSLPLYHVRRSRRKSG